MTLETINNKAGQLKDWYWEHGSQREGTWALGRGSWLDELHSITRRAAAIEKAEHAGSRKTLALWGPSQTGKSTLLAEYIDPASADGVGNGTALQWSKEEPVLFVGDIKGGTVNVLNPYNKGADASGCVTRFVMRESVEDPKYPVEVTFASEAQIMHALAVGYLSETSAKTVEGGTLLLNLEGIEKIISGYKSSGEPQREAFELLVEVADTIDLLIRSGIPRYEDLDQEWRRSILESEALLSSIDNVREFAYQIFWDSWTSLTDAFEALREKCDAIRSQFGTGPIRCNYPLAALLLNISSTELYGRADAVRQTVDGACFQSSGASSKIGGNSGQRLFAGAHDFGLFQGLVWQLTVPLQASVIRDASPVVHELLTEADLLDFPGVANESRSADPFSNDDLHQNQDLIFAKVLKRGKTASIVVTSSRDLDIDGFSLLMRMGNYPSKPKQLKTGIQCWFESFGRTLPPKNGETLPLNLVLTFSAKLINDTRASGVGHGLEPVFDKMQGLGSLADPKVVTTFATNYPQFPDGHFQGDSQEVTSLVAAISNDRAFQRQFPETGDSLAEMAENGGKEYFFKHLINQAKNSIRASLIEESKSKLSEEFEHLMTKALPGKQDATVQRNQDFDTFLEGLERYLREGCSPDPGRELGIMIQGMINVAPENLDAIPRQAMKTQGRKPIRPFLEKQFSNWRESKATSRNYLKFVDGDEELVSRMLVYLYESVSLDLLQEWFLKNLGNIRSRPEQLESRRFLATRMNNQLLRSDGTISRNYPEKHKVQELITRLAESEFSSTRGVENSPYHISVIKPLIERLNEIKSDAGSERGEQPGDSALLTLLN